MMVEKQYRIKQIVDWRFIVVQNIYSNHPNVFGCWGNILINWHHHNNMFWQRINIFSVNFLSTVHHDFLSHGAAANYSYGLLDAQRSPRYVRYHALSNNKLYQISRKRICGGNGGSDKNFIYTNHMEEQWLTLYIDSNIELPYFYFVRGGKLAVWPQSGVIYYLYKNAQF